MELRERVIEKLEEAMMLSEASNECKVTLGYGVVEDILALLKEQGSKKEYVYIHDVNYDDWSGAQGNNSDRIREEQERAYWGVYG